MAFPGLLGLGEDSSDSSSSDEDEEQRRSAWQKVLDNIAAEAGELAHGGPVQRSRWRKGVQGSKAFDGLGSMHAAPSGMR